MMLEERGRRIREFFDLSEEVRLHDPDTVEPDLTAEARQRLGRFNIEWHIIPSDEALPFDERYIERLYGMRSRDFSKTTHQRSWSYQAILATGHRRHQGKIIGVETTQKPRYLPGNRQHYGTPYGFDSTADPFARYLGRAGFLTGTRYAHNYRSLREFIDVVNSDWRTRGLIPQGYRLTICPPAVFNLIGSIFHPQWSETESLELGFYRDEHGNAKCYSVGSNAPGDFSYIHEIETDTDWTLLGFRNVLVPV